MTASAFTDEEIATLRTHGIALFANRVIFDAQPPIDPAVLAHVKSLCAGPILQELLELRNITAELCVFRGSPSPTSRWPKH